MTNSTKYTTAGSILLKSQMPTEESKKGFDLYRTIDKNGMASMINMLLVKGGENAHDTINSLGQQFFNKATEIGASTPLEHYINDSEERDTIIQEFDSKVQKILGENKNKTDQNAALAELTGQYNKKIEKQNLDFLLKKKSMVGRMAATGARGNPAQLAVGTSTPLMSAGLTGNLIPIVIKNSFAQGMSPAEQLALSYMGRASTVAAQLSTSLPGALFKRLSPTLFGTVITLDDCNTKNGILQKADDSHAIIGRYEAVTNHLIDEQYQADLMMSGVKEVKVRSTMTCEAHDGVCKKCYGLMASGKVPNIGENIGVIAAQSISEKLTQSMLGTKHRATVGERKGNAYTQAANLLNNPAQNFQDEATISTVNGTVTRIVPTALGDNTVYVGETKHFVPIIQKVVHSVGDTIKQGDRLSTGTINPRTLVTLRGIGAGRHYLSQELRGIYGKDLDPRHFEVVASNLIKYVQIEEPGETGYLPGDKVTVSNITKYLQNSKGRVHLDKAEGKILAQGVLNLTPGTLLDGNHIEELKEKGIEYVEVSPTKLRVIPLVPGLQTAKLLDKNWISKLSFSKLKDTITQAAAYNEESAVHSTDPITPYIMGTEFGESPNGKY
jgi:DNA-directed RNA polymerase subunit beta'